MDILKASTAAILKEGLLSLGITPSDNRVRFFSVYLAEIKKWNKACNLTGIQSDQDIIIKHFLDSILYLKPMPNGVLRIADVGSGAGFPGIPIKIVRPGLKMFLIEPSGKKAAFLRHMIKLLQLEGIEVIEKRIEKIQLPSELGTPVDIALTRALYAVEEFVRKAAHVVKPDGLFILSKGPKVRGELERARNLEYKLLEIPLPQTNVMRYLVVVKAISTVSF